MVVLLTNLQTVCGGIISAVKGRGERLMPNGYLLWEALAFVIDEEALVFSVMTHPNRIVVSQEIEPSGKEWLNAPTLAGAVGKELGWWMEAKRHPWYRDSLVMAFGSVLNEHQLRLTFFAEGPAIQCVNLTPRNR